MVYASQRSTSHRRVLLVVLIVTALGLTSHSRGQNINVQPSEKNIPPLQLPETCGQLRDTLLRLTEGRIRSVLPVLIKGAIDAVESEKNRLKNDVELRMLMIDLTINLATLGMGTWISHLVNHIPVNSSVSTYRMALNIQAVEASGVLDKIADVPKKLVSRQIENRITPLYGQKEIDLFINFYIDATRILIDQTAQEIQKLSLDELCVVWKHYNPSKESQSTNYYAQAVAKLINRFKAQVDIIGSCGPWYEFLFDIKTDCHATWLNAGGQRRLGVVRTSSGVTCNEPFDAGIGGPSLFDRRTCHEWKEISLVTEIDNDMLPYALSKTARLHGKVDELSPELSQSILSRTVGVSLRE